jgi:uncharacterized protein (TIGR03083 family)
VVDVRQLGPAIDVRAPFAAVRAALVELLAELSDHAWSTPTSCPGWMVHDIVAHLLHDDLRRISRSRDHYFGEPAAGVDLSPVDRLNEANQRWVADTDFLSPLLLADLLAHTSSLVEAMWADADLDAPGEGVWWAGIEVAPVWLDLARDYSEDWTHQQQIREAIGLAGLTEPRFLDPVLDTFLRALPRTYLDVQASDGTSVLITITDQGRELIWSLRAERQGWMLRPGHAGEPTARVWVPADTLWRLATGGISPDIARSRVATDGRQTLAEPLFQIVSVVR